MLGFGNSEAAEIAAVVAVGIAEHAEADWIDELAEPAEVAGIVEPDALVQFVGPAVSAVSVAIVEFAGIDKSVEVAEAV